MALTVKTLKEVESEMVQAVSASTTKVTWFGDNGIVKAIIKALAAQIRDLYQIINTIARSRYLDTAIGADLDALGAESGVPRLGANPASVVLVFKGTVSTVVLQNTVVNASTTGIQYKTQNQITVGTKNNGLLGAAESLGLGDAVIAVAQTNGSVGNTTVDTVNVLPTPISGITGVTNPAPAQGGQDAESDEQYRERIRNRVNLANQGTLAFYNALAVESDVRVLRALPKADPDNEGISVVLVSKGGAGFSGGDLISIAATMYDGQRGFNNITCVNVQFTAVAVTFETVLETGYTLDDVYVRVADAIANYLDFQTWGWGTIVQDNNLIDVINGVAGVGNIDLPTYKLNTLSGDVAVALDSLPRFTRLTIKDKTTSVTKDVMLDQGYI